MKKKHIYSRTFNYLVAFVKWVLIALVIGAVGGLVGIAFHVSVDKVTSLRQSHDWILFLLPVGGLVITLLYKLFKLENAGTNDVIESVRAKGPLPIMLPFLIFVSTVITHLFGGSAGREGAALQLGGGIGSQFGRLFKLDEKDMTLAVLCGMSGVFSALFGTPLTAALFALEVISVGLVYYSGLIPCLVSAFTAYYFTTLFHIPPVRFMLDEFPKYNFHNFLLVFILASLSAVLSIIFCLAMSYSEILGKKIFKNNFIKAFIGGGIIIVLSLIFGRDYNGAGMNIIELALSGGKVNWYAFVLKIIFTAITISSGFKGGEIVPTLFIGSTFGCVIAPLLGLDPAFGAAIAVVSMFCGVVNCPIASIFLSIEIFGSGGLLFFAISSALGYILSGYFGLYSSQKIIYSKTKAEYININTWHEIE